MTVDEMLRGGIAAIKAGDMARAAQLFTSVVQADPQSERGWLGLGLCQTEPKKQAYCFRRVLAINPENPVARKKLAALSTPAPVFSTNIAPPAPVPAPATAAPRARSKPLRSGTRLVVLASVVAVLLLCGATATYLYASGQIAPLAASVVAWVKSPTPSPTNTSTPSPTVTPTMTMTPTAVLTPTPALGYRPLFERASCMFAVPDGAKVDCGFVVVPEDREKNPAHTIRLAVAIYHGPDGKVAPDPVVFLHGGPGGNAVMWSSQVYSTVVLPIVRERDLVVFDQRGAGLSTPPLECPELTKAYMQDMQSVMASDKRESLYTNALLGCHNRLVGFGVDPAAYTTLASAADVRDILIALKYKQKANLYGISYGTRLAQMVMREYPEIVRSVVIDSVLPLEVKLYNQGSATSDYALRTLFQGCAADPACQSAYPNLDTVYAGLVKQLDKKPVTVPVSLPLGGLTLPGLSQTYETTVTGLSLTNDLLWVLQRSELIPSVPQALYHIRNGDYSLLRYAAALPPQTLGDISMGVYLSINCHEQVYATTPDELGADLAQYPSTEAIATAHIYGSGQALFNICGLWQAKPLTEGENALVASDIPTLIVAGAYDPTTPPSFGQQVGSHLSRSYLFEFPDQGHGPTAGAAPCPMRVVTAFFNDPPVEPDRACLKETKPVRFLTPYTGAPPLELTAYEDKKLGVVGLIPATWKDIGYGFFSRSASPLDQTQIGQQTDTSAIADWLKWLSTEFNARRGFDKTPVQTGERRANQFVWKLYHTTSEGLPVDLAFARSGSRTLLIIMQSYPDEQRALYQTVFLPLVDAATLEMVLSLPTNTPAATPTASVILPPEPFVNCASQNEIPAAECDALVALYNSTNGADWKSNKGWLKARWPCNNWYGVYCSNGHVKILQLGSNNLSGSIPAQLGSLTNLQILSLGNNALTGPIPAELGNLTSLTSLSVDNNHLTGPIPAQLGNLTNLTDLELGNNQLTGSIPSQLGNLTNLTALGVSSNQLTGSIPTELGNLTTLKRLSLSGNQLTGSIPSALGSLTQLQILTLNNNPLTGSVPTELSNLKQLQALFLGDTQLTGEIPASFVNLVNLSHLTLGCGLTSSDPTLISFIDGILGSGWDVACPK